MVEPILKSIKRHYVSADIANKICDTVSWKLANHQYDSSLNPDEFAFEITNDLIKVSHDYHFSVVKSYPVDTIAMRKRINSKDFKKCFQNKNNIGEFTKRTKDDMFKYGEIKILPGNIGYVEIKEFGSTSYIKSENKGRISFESVMKFLKNTDGIIIDLRHNRGGLIKQAANFCSFFSPLPDNYFATTEYYYMIDSCGTGIRTIEVDTVHTTGKFANSITEAKSIFILTSQSTFSAAEISTYKLKRYHSSTTIVGEKTIGGGNGHSGGFDFGFFTAVIPDTKLFDENNSNYSLEGKGITPDIAVSADSAFNLAYKLALAGKIPSHKKIRYFRKINPPPMFDESNFQRYYSDYTGNYRKYQILKSDDHLYIVANGLKEQLWPSANDQFISDTFYSVKFIRDDKGCVAAIQVWFDHEFMEEFRRLPLLIH